MIPMPLFADFQMLPIGSADDHARYMAKYNYRYYCVSCIRSIESIQKIDKCQYCSSSNLILLMEKEVKEKVPWQERVKKFMQAFQQKPDKNRRSFLKSKEELPTH